LNPLEDQKILDDIIVAKQDFGMKCPKYAGAITVEIFRSALQKIGFIVSERDVFIRGVPFEIDLLIPSFTAKPKNRILYEPFEVMVAFEIKNTGMFGELGVKAIRRSFAQIKSVNEKIECIYLTLTERPSYKWAVTTEKLGLVGEAFTLFGHSSSEKKMVYTSSGDWQKFINKLSLLTQPKMV
jgi:hypothetical protein